MPREGEEDFVEHDFELDGIVSGDAGLGWVATQHTDLRPFRPYPIAKIAQCNNDEPN